MLIQDNISPFEYYFLEDIFASSEILDIFLDCKIKYPQSTQGNQVISRISHGVTYDIAMPRLIHILGLLEVDTTDKDLVLEYKSVGSGFERPPIAVGEENHFKLSVYLSDEGHAEFVHDLNFVPVRKIPWQINSGIAYYCKENTWISYKNTLQFPSSALEFTVLNK